MAGDLPEIDHSLWRYYADHGSGRGTAGVAIRDIARRLGRSLPDGAGGAAGLRLAASALRRQQAGAGTRGLQPGSSAPGSAEGEASAMGAAASSSPGRDGGGRDGGGQNAAARARQALLGLLLPGNEGGPTVLAVDEAAFRDRIETLSPVDLKRLASFLTAVRATEAGPAASPSSSPSGRGGAADRSFASVERDLERRGISLNLSAKTNNVYITDGGSRLEVSSSEGGDADPRDEGRRTASGSSRRRNLGFTLGRMTRNFILGH